MQCAELAWAVVRAGAAEFCPHTLRKLWLSQALQTGVPGLLLTAQLLVKLAQRTPAFNRPVIMFWDLGSLQMATAYSLKQPEEMDCSSSREEKKAGHIGRQVVSGRQSEACKV
jgi:hypothetical protein